MEKSAAMGGIGRERMDRQQMVREQMDRQPGNENKRAEVDFHFCPYCDCTLHFVVFDCSGHIALNCVLHSLGCLCHGGFHKFGHVGSIL